MKSLIAVLLLILGCAISSICVDAQGNIVELKFEIDGKEIKNPKFKIVIYTDHQVIEPALAKNGFVVPTEIRTQKKVAVRFVSGKYNLYFNPVNDFDFESTWTIRIKNPPFNSDEESRLPPPQPNMKLIGIYYLTFNPKEGEGTEIIVNMYK